jgi:hypothetical protein
MKLPDDIERELQRIEAEYQARGGQQAGVPRLRALRQAIANALRRHLDEERLWQALPCAMCGTVASRDGDWYRLCGPCYTKGDEPAPRV